MSLPVLPAHVVNDHGHELTLAVGAVLVSAIGAVSLVSAFLERRGRLDGTTPSIPFDRWAGIIAAGWSVGAAAIHFAVIGEHFQILPAEGVFFIVVAWFQVGWAALFVARPTGLLALVGGLVNLAVVAVWAWSRWAGLPFGGHGGATEPIAVNDAIATAFEILLVATLALGQVIRGGPLADRLRLPTATAVAWTGSALAVAVVLGSVGIVQGASHDHAVAEGEAGHALPGAAGSITFGSQLEPGGGIVDPTDTLSAAGEVMWVAVFTEAAGVDTVELVVSTLDGAGAETERAREEVFLARSDIRSLTEVRDLGSIGGGPGTYRVRYLLLDEVLAQGDVTLVP